MRPQIKTKDLQHWLNEAGDSKDKIIYLPAGDYLIDNSLWVPPGVVIIGANHRAPYSTRNFPISVPGLPTKEQEESYYHVGTTFLVRATDGPCLLFGGDGCEVHGVTFYYPDQDPANLKWYPPTISTFNGSEYVLGLAIVNNLFVNTWDAIVLGAPGMSKIGQVRIVGNQGQILNTGVTLGKVLDITRVSGNHWWVFWKGGQVNPISKTVGLRVYQSDWLLVHDWFSYGVDIGIQLLLDENDKGCSGTFSTINIDACDIGVEVFGLAEWGVTFRDLNVVCLEISPFGVPYISRTGIIGREPTVPHPWASNSNFKLDGFRVEGALAAIDWKYPAPMIKSSLS